MIEIKNLTFSYLNAEGKPKAEVPQLNRVNLTIEPGEFVLVCGPTGSGKSTFLKTLNGLAPNFTGGVITGELLINSVNYLGAEPHELSHLVGYVNQQPEGAFVADIVLDEIVYSAEQLAISREQIDSDVERLSKLLGLEELLKSPLSTLSGGQQQRVAIAAALISGAKVLLLDEPTSALDLEGATEVLNLLQRLAREEGVSVLLAEHRISRVIGSVDSVIVVHGDGSVTKGKPAEQFNDARFAPPIIELGQQLGWNPLAMTTKQAQGLWKQAPSAFKEKQLNQPGDRVLEVIDLEVSFGSISAVKKTSLTLFGNQITALMGENGSGKTSLCWAIQGSGTRNSGSVKTNSGDPKNLSVQDRLSITTMVPQRAADLLFLNSLADELQESDTFANVPAGTTANLFQKLAGRIDSSIHPRDLSAGQQLSLVLSLQLVKNAPVLILDEPTRGLDYAAKRALAKQLDQLRDAKRSVLLATHDIEFVAMVADRVLVLKDGVIVEDASPLSVLASGQELASQIAEVTNQAGLITIGQVLN
jgi:energy-coupling factor transport system ATP-binding protein